MNHGLTGRFSARSNKRNRVASDSSDSCGQHYSSRFSAPEGCEAFLNKRLTEVIRMQINDNYRYRMEESTSTLGKKSELGKYIFPTIATLHVRRTSTNEYSENGKRTVRAENESKRLWNRRPSTRKPVISQRKHSPANRPLESISLNSSTTASVSPNRTDERRITNETKADASTSESKNCGRRTRTKNS